MTFPRFDRKGPTHEGPPRHRLTLDAEGRARCVCGSWAADPDDSPRAQATAWRDHRRAVLELEQARERWPGCVELWAEVEAEVEQGIRDEKRGRGG